MHGVCRLNGIVAEAAESEEGKSGLIPAYAGFKADLTAVPGSDERIVMIKLFFNADPFETVLCVASMRTCATCGALSRRCRVLRAGST